MSATRSSPPGPAGPPLAKGTAAEVPPFADRSGRAWRAWLATLARDADAATAAAHVYAELPAEARDAWLDALAEDGPLVEVPLAALYGPLLAVEADPERAARMRRQCGPDFELGVRPTRALVGAGDGGMRLAVLLIPLYLDFVRVLVFRFHRETGFEWTHQLPIVGAADVPAPGDCIEGITIARAPAEAVIDELAHAVVAHVRSGQPLPQLLRDEAGLFNIQREPPQVRSG
jgi:hypothetical protein